MARPRLRNLLLGGLIAAACCLMGAAAAVAEIGWTVIAANGVRDIAILSMTEQAEALQQCRAAAAVPPPATNRIPRRFRL